MPDFPALIDLANLGSYGFKIQGAEPSDFVGFGLSGADVNGDGFDDLIVSAYWSDAGDSNAGQVYVIFGKASGFGPIDLAAFSAADGFRILGDAPYDNAGISLSSAGDFNGDGFEDVIIGAWLNNGGGADAGAAYVVFGKSTGFGTIDLATLSAADGFKIQGDNSDDHLGRSVSNAGDVNGDGFGDLIIGANFNDSGGYASGAAYVVFGKASGFGTIDLGALAAADGFRIQGDLAGDWAGWTVSSAGDHNGDGFDDLLVGAQRQDGGGYNSGASYLIFGKAEGLGAIDLTTLAAADGFKILGDGDYEGASRVSSAGDVNGDGYDDFLIGGPGNSSAGAGAGAAYVIFGKGSGFGTLDLGALTAADGFKIEGEGFNNGAGIDVSAAGDVNGDGFADVLVGAIRNSSGGSEAGAAYVVFGKSSGFGTVDLGALTGADGFKIQGENDGDQAGFHVGSAGDVNGDGFDDVMVGAWRNDSGGDNAGAAYIVFGIAPTTAVTRTGSAADQTIRGGAGADTLDGAGGDDILVGGAGVDTLIGGAGDDVFIVDDALETVTEASGGGIDEIRTALASYSLASLVNVERLTGLGSGNQSLTGNGSDNVIDGGAGADSMTGGLGNDSYVIDNGGDTIVELSGEGTDEVRTALATFSLAAFANVENLTGTSGSGQTLTGSAAANLIVAGSGNDVIDGGLGADMMTGGLGNDIYFVDSLLDGVVEQGDGGTDEIRTALAAYTLAAEVEKLTGLSSLGQALTGNGLANTLTGGLGNDVLDGGVGSDAMIGGFGDDVFIVDAVGDVVTEGDGQGTDEIRTALATYSLAAIANVENLTGGAADQTLTGNGFNNVIDGGLGADSMAGGGGHDVYVVDNLGDMVTELDGAGTDEIRTSLSSFSLVSLAHIENLTGSDGDQILTGNGLANVIDGGAGADAMSGGAGNDVYLVDNLSDSVTEADGGGVDEVRTSLGSKAAPAYALYFLPDHVENLTGTSAGAQGVRGNALNNVVTMAGGADLIVLDDGGVETVDAGGGNDFIYYGATLTGADVTNGGAGTDTLGLLGNYAGGSAITFTAANLVGVERLALYTGGGTNSYTITTSDSNVASGGELFVTAASLAAAEILIFNGGAETNGRFTVLGGSGGDTIVGGQSSDYLAGNAGNDLLYGLGSIDFLIGGAGADQLRGGAGGDFFRYAATSESMTGSVDQILDFQHIDRIDLSAIDSNGNAGDGNSAFTFIGANAFGNVAGQLRATLSGGVWTVEGDTNGDGAADLVIQVTLTEPAPLGAADFIL